MMARWHRYSPPTALRRFLLHQYIVAGFGLTVEMQFGTASVELEYHRLDAPLDYSAK